MSKMLKYGRTVGVTREETGLPYYKYFTQPMASVPPEKLALLDQGPLENGLPFEDRNMFLSGRDEELGYAQVGWGINRDGTGFVANTTYMPGVTGAMLDWWFPWHSVGSDLRYKIWDPKDHYFARADSVAYVCNPRIPVNQKTWGVDHYIMENTGMGPEFLQLCFKRPRDFGFDEGLVGSETCESLVCAIGKSKVAAAMTHKWYPWKDGVMFCSRFWIGYGEVRGKIIRTLPEGIRVPAEAPKGLFHHTIEEFANLAAILPEVYGENRDNW